MHHTTKIHLKPNTVHIWSLNFVVNDDAYNKYHSLLSEDEKTRASKFKFYKDKRCYVVGKGVLRLLSGKYLNNDAKAIVFEYGKQGKPKFKYEAHLNFNVSHSGDIAIIGFVYDHTIGIDIEIIKDDFDTLEIANNFFSKKEIAELRKIPNPQKHIAFYRCWTRKESFIKAKGQGLSFPLDSFSVSIDSDEKSELLETKWDEHEKNFWNLFSFSPKEKYIGAISVRGEVNKVQYFNFNDYFKTLSQ